MTQAWAFDPLKRELSLLSREPIPLRAGAIQVRMEAALVPAAMHGLLRGARTFRMPDRSFIPGMDAVGTILSTGEGVYHLNPGMRVLLHPYVRVGERVADPAHLLIGLAALAPPHDDHGLTPTGALQRRWADGAFAQIVEWPAALATPLDTIPDMPPEALLGLSKFLVPYGGLLRAELVAGETIVVNGATGFYGSAAVVLAVALGARRIVALGRHAPTLSAVAAVAGPRVKTVQLTLDPDSDMRAIIAAAGGRPDLALDLSGPATNGNATLAALRCLRRGGRLVVMGGCSEPLGLMTYEMLMNDWVLMGQCMYPEDTPRRLVDLVSGALLDLSVVRIRTFPFAALRSAIEHAAAMRGLDMTVIAG